MQTHTIPRTARQGDVYLMPTTKRPSPQAKTLEQGRQVTLAWGEATGHPHRVVCDEMPLTLGEMGIGATNADPVPAMTLMEDQDGTLLLLTRQPSTFIHHDGQGRQSLDHGPHPVVPDWYEVVRQEEWDNDKARRAAD